MKPGKDLRIYAMGRKRFLQIMKCHVSDSGMYTCDAGDATTSCTVEVYGKACCLNIINHRRGPLVSQRCDVLVWAGCVFVILFNRTAPKM